MVKAPGTPDVEAIAPPLRRFYSGTKTVNSACVALSYSASEISEVIEHDPHVHVLYK